MTVTGRSLSRLIEHFADTAELRSWDAAIGVPLADITSASRAASAGFRPPFRRFEPSDVQSLDRETFRELALGFGERDAVCPRLFEAVAQMQ